MSKSLRGTKCSIEMGMVNPHRDIITRAISNVLSTEIAAVTYAQIVDGLPLASVIHTTSGSMLPKEHPVRNAHKELCLGVLEMAKDFRARFDPASLELDISLINAFQIASPGSRAFKTRLVEITAIAVHGIAVQLFNLKTGCHDDDGIASWVPPANDSFWDSYPDGWPTLFRHEWYNDHEQYPDGVADMAGYWAESQILGGVVLFDRRDPEAPQITDPDYLTLDVQPDSVWFHPDREDMTYRLYQLLDDQKQRLVDFLTSDSPDMNLLPIFPSVENTRREDPEEPIEEIGIYRDIWERKPLPLDLKIVDRRMRDVWDHIEYPTTADWERSTWRAYERRQQLWDSESYK